MSIAVFGVSAARAQTETSTTVEEELVDFEVEEARHATEDGKIQAKAGGGEEGKGGFGLKLFVDLRLEYRGGDKSFQFRPNHSYAFLQANVSDDLQIMFHISDEPVFWELTYSISPELSLTAGKLLIPFGTNDFHHIIGGRVDEQSHFLPETWGDFGLSVKHLLLDSKYFNLEYALYTVNGFSGVEEPNFAAGSLSDNNFFKGIGTRIQATIFGKALLTTSVYYDRWDVDNEQTALFYAMGLELQRGLFDVPILRHMRIRGEWARGEVGLEGKNYQSGITDYAYARAGYYLEFQLGLSRNIAIRWRMGRINPNNTVTDAGDVEVYEPAILVGLGTKLWWTVAYQMTTRPGFDRDLKNPADVVYGKLFLMY